jgi:hypothetical protein
MRDKTLWTKFNRRLEYTTLLLSSPARGALPTSLVLWFPTENVLDPLVDLRRFLGRKFFRPAASEAPIHA